MNPQNKCMIGKARNVPPPQATESKSFDARIVVEGWKWRRRSFIVCPEGHAECSTQGAEEAGGDGSRRPA